MTTERDFHPLRELAQALRASQLSPKTLIDAPLGPLTTYRVGGSAAIVVAVDNREDLLALHEVLSRVDGGSEVALAVIGRGSNLLICDDGFAGLIVTLTPGFAETTVTDQVVVAGGATKLPVLARVAVNAGLSGLEWAVGVPGSVGGAVRMNAGGHGAEIKDSLTTALLFKLQTGEFVWRSNTELAFDYRTSSVSATELVIQAQFSLLLGDSASGKAKMLEIVQWRRANQPGGQNAGSVFTNPDGDSAGRLIESVGAKGLRIGSAAVSTKHANFIQADENGCAADILALMQEIQRLVFAQHGVQLAFETRLLGFDGELGGVTTHATETSHEHDHD